jgi:hypothetical protein
MFLRDNFGARRSLNQREIYPVRNLLLHLHEPSVTATEFCALEGMSRTTYSELQKLKLGPVEHEYPGSGGPKISPSARHDWHRKLENPSPELAAVLERAREKRRAKSRKAAQASINSPNHINNPNSPARLRRKHGRRG